MALEDDLIDKIKVLNERLWEGRASLDRIEAWLRNFNGESESTERLHALFLLSQFLFVGHREMREMLRAMYRDLFQYPIVSSLRRESNDTVDLELLKNLYQKALMRTRFLGVGNPSESGCHLLYYYRQENALSKQHFIHTHEIFSRTGVASRPALRAPNVTRYVFIDDFCGSGTQAVDYSREIVRDIKDLDPAITVAYYVLFATDHGMKHVRESSLFR
jgi:hypothetical protein